MSGSNSMRIAKTIKMFMNGQFPRTESGRSFPVLVNGEKQIYANVCKASRKDLRQAVEFAASGFSSWGSRTAFNRSQILYRMAEMCEGKRAEIVDILIQTQGLKTDEANLQVDKCIDAFVYYAGFADKFQQVSATVNPVSGPYHNFTAADAVGVVGLISDSGVLLSSLIASLSAIICSGNSVVVIVDKENSSLTAALGEIFATSDLPAGAINLISTDDLTELYPHLGAHMEVHSVTYLGSDKKIFTELKSMAIDNMKRVVPLRQSTESLENITDFVEFKTVWHPIGL